MIKRFLGKAKKELTGVVLKKDYKRVPVEFIRAGSGRCFLVPPKEPVLLEFRFGRKNRDRFCSCYDGDVFKIKEVESNGVKTWICGDVFGLQREKLEGWARFLVTFKPYRGKLDIKGLRLCDHHKEQTLKNYLKEERGLEVTSQEVKGAAAEIRRTLESSQRDNLFFLIHNTIAWLDANLDNPPTYGYWREERSAKDTLERGLAGCSGITLAFVAICRSFGIPAKKVGGCIVKGYSIEDFHAWAIVYLSGYGWKEIDPTFKEFNDFSYSPHAYMIFQPFKGNVEVSAYKLVSKNRNGDVSQ